MMDLNSARQLGFFDPGHFAATSQSLTSLAPTVSTPITPNGSQAFQPTDYVQQLRHQQQEAAQWDFTPDSALSTTAPTALDDAIGGQTLATVDISTRSPMASEQSPFDPQRTRQTLWTRTPSMRDRDGHDRKRPRIAPDTTPFESIDYWLHFDNEQEIVGQASRNDNQTTPATSMGPGRSSSQHG